MMFSPPIIETTSTPPINRRGEVSHVILASIIRPEGETGVHMHTRMLSEGLRAAGVRCDVVSAFSGGVKWLAVFAVRPLLLHRINKTWSTLWHRKWHAAALRESLRRQVKLNRPDVIVAQCPVSARAAMDVRAQVGGDWRVAVVCHFNGSEADEYRDKGELANESSYRAVLDFEDRVLRDVDRVIFVSDWARQNVVNVRGIKTRSSAVIWNGLSDASASACSRPTISGFGLSRSAIGLSDDGLVLVNVGSLEPRKNQLGLLDLFAELAKRYPKAMLVLIGDGPQRGEIDRRIAELSLGSAVLRLGHRTDVPVLLPLADLYVHYAVLENCPLALIEAARAGLPFAAVPTGGVPELQRALDCPTELNPRDLSSSVENLRPLLDSVSARCAAGERARQRFVETFTREAMTNAYLDALSMS